MFRQWFEAMQTAPPPGVSILITQFPNKYNIEYDKDGQSLGKLQMFKNKCGHFQISWVGVDIRGYGPLLYEIAMELATKQGSMLVPDRTNTLAFLSVWKQFYERPEIQKVYLEPQCQVAKKSSKFFDEDIQALNTGFKKNPDYLNKIPIIFR